MRRWVWVVCLWVAAGSYAMQSQDVAQKCATARAAAPEKQRPPALDAALREIFRLRDAGKTKDALMLAQKAVIDFPERREPESAVGNLAYLQGDYVAAITAFRRAVEIEPCNAIVAVYLWRLYTVTGKLGAAEQSLLYAHEAAPKDARVARTWDAVELAAKLESEPGAPVVKRTDPPLLGFFAKTLDCDGIPVRASGVVDSRALVLACGKIRTMLVNLPAARKELHSAGAELHIIGDRQGTTDLPENMRYKNAEYVDAEGKGTDMDKRTRGVGGLMASCGEENLLGLPWDRYTQGEDLCTHEFAHDLMNVGLTGKQRSEIEKQYHEALKKGLWKGAYAAVDPKEFWADLTMWYFGTHGQYLPGAITTPGSDALRAYDPESFALLDEIYGGKK